MVLNLFGIILSVIGILILIFTLISFKYDFKAQQKITKERRSLIGNETTAMFIASLNEEINQLKRKEHIGHT